MLDGARGYGCQGSQQQRGPCCAGLPSRAAGQHDGCGEEFTGSRRGGAARNGGPAARGALTVSEPAPAVQSVVIDGGAVQRSMVTSLTVTFNEQVTLSSGAIVVGKKGGGAEGLILTDSVVNGDTVVNVALPPPALICLAMSFAVSLPATTW